MVTMNYFFVFQKGNDSRDQVFVAVTLQIYTNGLIERLVSEHLLADHLNNCPEWESNPRHIVQCTGAR